MACQNTPKSAAEAPQPAGTESSASPEALQAAITVAASSRELALSLRDQLDKLPEPVKSKNKDQIAAFYGELEGMVEKEGMMMGEMKATVTPAEKVLGASEDVPSNPINPSVLKDYSESIERYNKTMQEMQEKIKAMNSGN